MGWSHCRLSDIGQAARQGEPISRSQFIESLVRPHVIGTDLEEAYRQMAEDEAREAEALEWIEGTIGDVRDEAR